MTDLIIQTENHEEDEDPIKEETSCPEPFCDVEFVSRFFRHVIAVFEQVKCMGQSWNVVAKIAESWDRYDLNWHRSIVFKAIRAQGKRQDKSE